jgi:hypothetical protein
VAEQQLIHYYFTAWPDYNVVEPKKLLDLIETINKHRQHSFTLYEETTQFSSAPTVVHCRYEIYFTRKENKCIFFLVRVLVELVLILQ